MELIERINQRMEKINMIFEKLIDLVIKEVESLKKSQNPPAVPLVLGNGVSVFV